MNLKKERKAVNRLLADLKAARKAYKLEQAALKEIERVLLSQTKAHAIIQHVAQTVQQQAHERIEGVVSKCLEAVFGKLYGFRIDFRRKRGRTEAELILLKDGHEIEDALNADSGGVVDVAAFALRLACIVLSKPPLEYVMILDEPFRNLDIQNRQSVRMLLEELALDFKIQFIIVTHENAFQTGRVIRI